MMQADEPTHERKSVKTRAQINHSYYERNKHASHRKCLLHNMKTRGRVPQQETVRKYEIDIAQLVSAWRTYVKAVPEPSAEKIGKFQTLLCALV